MKKHLIIDCLLVFIVTIIVFGQSNKNVRAEPVPILPASGQAPGDVLYLNWTDHDGILSGRIPIVKGTSQILRFQRSISRAAISDEEICDIQPLGKHEVLIYSKQPGTVSLIVWDDQFNIASYEVESMLDINKLKGTLNIIDPKSEIEVEPFQKTIMVSGYVSTIGKVKQIEDAVKSFDEKAVTFVRVAEPKQILLEVRFAEVDRKANQDFGFDVETAFRDYYIRSLTGNTGASPSEGGAGDVNFFGGSTNPTQYTPYKGSGTISQLLVPSSTDGTANLYGAMVGKRYMIQPFLESLEQKNILKIIARPNLVTKDGTEATFLVGGEFPVPITTANSITVEWKPFGTNLKFTPEILENGTIRLQIKAIVSELDFTTTVTIQGTAIPTVLSRENQTVAELKEDQTLVIGGMLTQRINRINKKTPILGDIPFIGKAFKNEVFSRTDVELLVVVTPHIVNPIDTNERKVFYEKDQVLESIRPMYPAYTEPQGDMIRHLLTQGEQHQYFDDEAKKKAEKAEQAVKKAEEMQENKDTQPDTEVAADATQPVSSDDPATDAIQEAAPIDAIAK